MKISLTKAGKRFNRDWIFRNISCQLASGHAYAITGPNGSGKSTLLQAIAGSLALSEGTVHYDPTDGIPQPASGKAEAPQLAEDVHGHVAIAAPYLEVIEEFTLTEFLTFHQQFKPFLQEVSVPDIIGAVGLGQAAHKQIRYYSSGMKQRVKLAQAIFSDVPVLLLDEPCTNLDAEGIRLYQQLMDQYHRDRLIVISSNDPAEYPFCREILRMTDYK